MLGTLLANWVGIGVAVSLGFAGVGTLGAYEVHPRYLGACIAFLGFGLGLGSWLSAGVVSTEVVHYSIAASTSSTGTVANVVA
jgi:hypothetical protein